MITRTARLLAMALFLAWAAQALGAQRFDIPPSGYFYIQSALCGADESRGFWDQPGDDPWASTGAKLSLWDRSGGVDQQFSFEASGGGWYRIVPRNGCVLDIEGGVNADGVRVQVWQPNGTISQLFRFEKRSGARWKIYDYWGRVLCADGRKADNGSALLTWSDQQGAWTEWYLVDILTAQRFIPSSEFKGQVKGYFYGASQGRQAQNVSGSDVEVWLWNKEADTYSLAETLKADYYGNFLLPEKYAKEYVLMLLAKSEGRESAKAVVIPGQALGPFELVSEYHEESNYVLVDTLYRGKRYYYLEDGVFYLRNGKVSKGGDYFFTDIDKRSPVIEALLREIGAGPRTEDDDVVARRVGSVYAFIHAKTRRMSQKDAVVKEATDYLTSLTGPVDHWPTLEAFALVYQKYGFIPVGNCTFHSQLAATFLYAAGVSPNKFFISKHNYDMSWIVEHWVIAVNVNNRWYSLDPQHAEVIKGLDSAASFKKPYWETYLGKNYDYKKPFEAYILPGSTISKVPYVGDPAELQALLAAQHPRL